MINDPVYDIAPIERAYRSALRFIPLCLLGAVGCLINPKDYPVGTTPTAAGTSGSSPTSTAGLGATDTGGSDESGAHGGSGAGGSGAANGGATSGGVGAAGNAGGPQGVSGGGAAGESGASGYQPCANPVDVSGGVYGPFGPGETCLRTMDLVDTVPCSGTAPLTLNGAAVTCGVKTQFPPPIDGWNYFDVSASIVQNEWLFWAGDPCAAGSWAISNIYVDGSVVTGICVVPSGGGVSCQKGQKYAWICSGSQCSANAMPGGNDWWQIWTVGPVCN